MFYRIQSQTARNQTHRRKGQHEGLHLYVKKPDCHIKSHHYLTMINVFIGNIIRQKVKERKLTVSEFAKNINRSRTTVYDIFSRKSIDVDLLLTISEALDYDFLSEVYLRKKDNSAKKCFLAIEIDPSELPCDTKEVAETDKLRIRVLLKEKIRSILEQEKEKKNLKKH